MENVYDVNGLPFWSEREIAFREFIVETFAREVRHHLLGMNDAWRFTRIEAPLLTPKDVINPNYTADDVWVQDDQPSSSSMKRTLVLRPETTPGSYAYAQMLLQSSRAKPPFAVWQAGKSFRREQDQVTKNMRLKEFYQQEFQCIFTADTKNDYHANMLEPTRAMLQEAIGSPTRIVPSDRLPDYSLKTMDVEVQWAEGWMEVCSISLRKDFPAKFKVAKIKKESPNRDAMAKPEIEVLEKDLLVLEVAIGLDRCIHHYYLRGKP